nr:hypothetical protein [Tanacetum cinerariifolium]
MEVLLAEERILKLIQAWDEKQIVSWSLSGMLLQFLNDSQTIDEMLKQHEQTANLAVQQKQKEQAVQIFTLNWNFSMINDDEEHSIQYKEYLENLSNTITTVLPTEEPEYSLSMGDEHLSIIPEMKSDKVIKSSVKNIVPIPSEYEVIFDDESECDVPVKDEYSPVFTTFSNPIFDCNDDFTSSDDELLSDEDVPMEDFKVYSNPFLMMKKSILINYLEEFSGELMPTSIVNEERIWREHEEYISLMEKLLAINLFPRIENDDYDSERDIYFLEELLVNYSISLPENELSNFDHHDDLSFPRPPPEPPDVEFFFDWEPNSGEVNSAVIINNDEFIEDECFNL